MKKNLLIASNLHQGGGVQVATSVIFELIQKRNSLNSICIEASTEVAKNLENLGVKISDIDNFEVFNTYGASSIFKHSLLNLNNFSNVLTVFGPLYQYNVRHKSIVGFAQPWIIYPNNEMYSQFSFFWRVATKTKYWLQGLFFKRANLLIVELEHVKQALIRELAIPSECIHVIHNCLSSVYLNEMSWQHINFPKLDNQISLGFLGRNYPHKNTKIFPMIAAELKNFYNLKVHFFVTFTEREWTLCPAEFRDVCTNVGPLLVAQCPLFYKALDAVVFPSLLECFSATPLEAMAMEKPLFASDRPFNRDICGLHAHYFDPLDPSSAAQAIANVFKGNGPDPIALKAAREHAINFSSPKERAEKYLALLMGENPDNPAKT